MAKLSKKQKITELRYSWNLFKIFRISPLKASKYCNGLLPGAQLTGIYDQAENSFIQRKEKIMELVFTQVN